MNPTAHRPEIRDARPPAGLRTFDGNAVSAITGQWERMKETANVGDHLPDHENMPLYGHRFDLTDAAGNTVAVNFNIDANNQEDTRYVEARDRLATARSRERSRGSRMFNWAFRRDRGRGFGHHYNIDRYEAEYRTEFTDFIARKMQADGRFEDNFDLAVQASSRAVVQEQIQMGALERKAAEAKSGNRILNTLRNNKRLRIGVGVALSGLGVVGLATGIAPLAAAAFTARTALSAEGGYLLGRTGWDAVQGARARRLPHDDIRMVSDRNGDISGTLDARSASERLIKALGAEARAGSSDPARQSLIHTLGSTLVHQHYAQELEADLLANQVGAPDTRTAMRGALQAVYDSFTNPLQQERLASDQTQSRRRHVAGIVGGVVIGAIPGFRALGSMHIGLPFDGGNGGRAHTLANSIPKTNNHISHAIDGFKAPQATTPGAGGNVPGAGTTTPGAGNVAPGAGGNTTPGAGNTAPGTNGATPPGNGNTVPGASADSNANGVPQIIINGNEGDDTFYLGNGTVSINEAAAHAPGAGAAGHGAEAAGHGGTGTHHHVHETFNGISTGELHVKAGGGFLSTLQEQYNLNPAQAQAAYHAMYPHLLHAPGTYMAGSDIRISAPGDFKIPSAAQTALEEHLKSLHRMSDHLSTTGSSAEHAATATASPNVAEQASASVGVDDSTGGTIPPGTPSNPQTGGALSPTTPSPSATGGAIYNGGTGNNTIYVPGLTPMNPHVQALINSAHVPETGINSLTPDQAAQVQKFLADLIVSNGAVNTQGPAQAALQQYIEGSLNSPATGPDAQQAVSDLKQIWMDIGHNLNQLTTAQALKIQEDLKTISAG